jgi:gp16 family phage-associated protein
MDASITDVRADEIRREFARQGVSISSWARAHGYSSQLVYQVLAGRKRCVRGQCHQIAVRLGLKEGVLGSVANIDALGVATDRQEQVTREGEEAQ